MSNRGFTSRTKNSYNPTKQPNNPAEKQTELKGTQRANKHMQSCSAVGSRQENANQNHKETPPHARQNGYYKIKQKIIQFGEDALLMGTSTGAATMESTMENTSSLVILQKVKHRIAIPSSDSTTHYILKITENRDPSRS